ncbi:MAG: CPBP family intramembrane metalloprotease [Clostridia bacterium]|nr:CPBP family intramembrane metalloprotease [Clostridia bacterium]
MTKELSRKKTVLPNEASWLRWLAFIVVHIIIGTLISLPFEFLVYFEVPFITQSLGKLTETIRLLNQFFGLFIGAVICLRLIAKTTVRDFIYGVGGKGNSKQNLTVIGLYLLGMLLSVLPFIGNITVREFSASEYLISLLFVVAFTWMQTSWEEIIFRGIFIRFACKNNISCTTKAVVWGIISSLLFMAMHLSNPEVLTQSGFQFILSCLPYFLSGMGLYFANIYFKSLMPGLIIHWINNFLNFTLITSVVSAGGFPSLFVDNTPPTGLYYLITTVVCYIPLYVYIVINLLKKRKESKTLEN